MSEPKPLASLSPTLLARKGGARPAMRPQLHYPDSLARAVVEDDLGWNDMGEEDPAETGPEPSFTVSSIPAPSALAQAESSPAEIVPIKAQVELPAEPAKPAVVQHQEEIARQVVAAVAVETAPVRAAPVQNRAPARQRRSALGDGRRAAFTLRMDGERHLKLRLACTIRNCSAQQLVTEALDQLIGDLPDLTTLAAQVAERR